MHKSDPVKVSAHALPLIIFLFNHSLSPSVFDIESYIQCAAQRSFPHFLFSIPLFRNRIYKRSMICCIRKPYTRGGIINFGKKRPLSFEEHLISIKLFPLSKYLHLHTKQQDGSFPELYGSTFVDAAPPCLESFVILIYLKPAPETFNPFIIRLISRLLLQLFFSHSGRFFRPEKLPSLRNSHLPHGSPRTKRQCAILFAPKSCGERLIQPTEHTISRKTRRFRRFCPSYTYSLYIIKL